MVRFPLNVNWIGESRQSILRAETAKMKVKTLLLAALLLLTGLPAPSAPADLAAIEALAAEGRTERALSRLEAFLAEHPTDFEGLFLKGVLLVESRRTTDAEAVFLRLAREHPDRPEPINNLAVLKAASGKRATAIAALEDLVAHYPTYETAATNLERIRVDLGAATNYDQRLAAETETPAPAAPSSKIQLVLTGELGSHPRAEPEPEPALAAEPAPTAAATAAARAGGATAATGGVLPAATPMTEAVVEAESRPEAPGAESPTAATVEAATAEPGEEAEVAPGAIARDLRVELANAVSAWAAAWSEQRVKNYLSFYAADFQPTGFSSREAWEATRRQRVAAPSFIEVDIDLGSMRVTEIGPDQASATFVQRYRSDRYGDTVEKTLVFVREDGGWRIRTERSP